MVRIIIRSNFVPILLVFLLSSCKKEFSINASYEDFPIVYAITNTQDSTHYFKIYKSYLGETSFDGASDLSKISYLDSIEVYVDEYDARNNLLQTVRFDTTTAVAKDSGLFAYPTQILYAGNLSVNPDNTYHLRIFNRYTHKMVEGETNAIDSVRVMVPRKGVVSPTSVAISDNEFRVEFYGDEYATMYEAVVYFYYTEEYVGGSKLQPTPVVWNLGTLTSTESSSATQKITASSGGAFFRAIAAQVSNNEQVSKRYVDSIVLEVTSATNDLQKYISANQPSTGINQERLNYTNLKAYNTQTNEEKYVLGLFSNRCKTRVQFDNLSTPGSKDSLFYGRYTKNLKFTDIY